MSKKAKITVELNKNDDLDVEVYGEKRELVISLVHAMQECKDLEEIIDLSHQIFKEMEEEVLW